VTAGSTGDHASTDVPQASARAQDVLAFAAVEEASPIPILGDAAGTVIPRAGLAVIGGKAGAGKSTTVIDLGVHLAGERSWLGFDAAEGIRVLLLENEGPRHMLRRKLAHRLDLAKDAGHPVEPGRVFVYDDSHDGVGTWAGVRLDDAKATRRLRATIKALEIDLVIAGPISSFGLGIGSPEDADRLAHNLQPLGLGTTTAFLLHTHLRKADSKDEIDSFSGAWERPADAVMLVRPNGTGTYRLTFPKLRWRQGQHGGLIFQGETADSEIALVKSIEQEQERDLRGEVVEYLAENSTGKTAVEIAAPATKGGIGANRDAVESVLAALEQDGLASCVVGPPGRAWNAHCWYPAEPPS
jgi:AAA domain